MLVVMIVIRVVQVIKVIMVIVIMMVMTVDVAWYGHHVMAVPGKTKHAVFRTHCIHLA
jgi:hypothetical protein